MQVNIGISDKFPSQQLSRTTLQLLSKDKHYFARKTAVGNTVRSIYQSCGNEALRGKTQYVFNPNTQPLQPNNLPINYMMYNGKGKEAEDEFSVYISDLLEALKHVFPGCDINYHETKGFEGKIIERIVSIDWSWS